MMPIVTKKRHVDQETGQMVYGFTVQPGLASLPSCSQLRRSVVRWTTVLEGISSSRRTRSRPLSLFNNCLPTRIQLALNLPYLRNHINDITQANPTKSMMVQMRSLIIDFFQKLSENIEHTPRVIVDGLDACDGHETQQLISGNHLRSSRVTQNPCPVPHSKPSRGPHS